MERNGGIVDLRRATSWDGMKACKIPARDGSQPSSTVHGVQVARARPPDELTGEEGVETTYNVASGTSESRTM